MARFPSTCEIKCAGFAMIASQILFCIAWALQTIDYDVYDVDNEEDVIELHNVLSSSAHRTEVEVACTAMWISFPLMIISLYGIKRWTLAIFEGTNAELVIYLLEKAYLVFITVVGIMLPALSLVSVSYEWSFHEYTVDAEQVATGYYIQLYVETFLIELVDCVAIADGTFMVCLFILPRFILLGSKNPKFQQFRQIMEPKCCRGKVMAKCCVEILGACFVTTLLIIFGIVLFEFAESGFFSPTGHAKFLVIWSFILKFLIGVRLIRIAFSSKHEQLKKVFVNNYNIDDGNTKMIHSGNGNNYQMNPIQNSNENVDDAEL